MASDFSNSSRTDQEELSGVKFLCFKMVDDRAVLPPLHAYSNKKSDIFHPGFERSKYPQVHFECPACETTFYGNFTGTSSRVSMIIVVAKERIAYSVVAIQMYFK